MTPSTAYILYLVFAIGGAGIYFLFPRGGESKPRVGATIGLLALGSLITLFAARASALEADAFFYIFAAIAIAGGARVITHPRPVYSALYFVLVVVAVASMLVLLGAEFAAVALIIVYAGAILVTYLFVIMLAQQGGSPVYDRRAREPFLAVIAGFLLTATIAARAGDLPEVHAPMVEAAAQSTAEEALPAEEPGNTVAIGMSIMTRYVVALQIGGVLLLVSMVGAIALSRKRVKAEGFVSPQKPLGQVGKEVPPF